MAHELHRLAASVYNQPLLVSQEQLTSIEEYLDARNGDSFKMLLDKSKRPMEREELRIENGVGVVSVQGAITSKANLLFESFCGMVSYETILSQVNSLCQMKDVHTILLDVDSGGGEALNMVATSREMRKVCRESGTKLIGYANGTAASAAMGLISACDEIYMTDDSSVGSIGVLLALRNSNKKDEKDGISTTYITAGSEKIPFDKETMEFREEFLDDLQVRVDEMYGKFTALVAEQRNISLEDVVATQARMFSSDKAIALGLVDGVKTPTEFYTWLADLSEENSLADASASPTASNHNDGSKLENERQEETLMSDVNTEASAELLAQLDALKAQNAVMAEKLEASQAKEKAEQEAALSEQLDTMAFVADCKEELMDFLLSAEEAQVSLMNTILGNAQASVDSVAVEAKEKLTTVEAEAAAKVEEANAKVEAAEQASLEVKKEFGKQTALEGDPKDRTVEATATSGAARTAQLEALVKSKLANK